MTQGYLGYMIAQSLKNTLSSEGIKKDVACVVTQVLVDKNDQAFHNPSKPVGPFYSKSEAERLALEKGWNMIEDAGRGYRRVVPSPIPLDIIEIEAIKLIKNETIIIAAGGGESRNKETIK